MESRAADERSITPTVGSGAGGAERAAFDSDDRRTVPVLSRVAASDQSDTAAVRLSLGGCLASYRVTARGAATAAAAARLPPGRGVTVAP